MKFLAIVAGLALTTSLFATEAPKSVKRLTQKATHVVTGLITATSSKDVDGVNGKGSIDARHSFTVKISKVTLGDDLKTDQVIECTTRKAKRGGVEFGVPGLKPVIWAQGQTSIPKKGDVAQFFLQKQKDGTYWAITPNGIKVQENKAE